MISLFAKFYYAKFCDWSNLRKFKRNILLIFNLAKHYDAKVNPVRVDDVKVLIISVIFTEKSKNLV